jgi:hypothetical protein
VPPWESGSFWAATDVAGAVAAPRTCHGPPAWWANSSLMGRWLSHSFSDATRCRRRDQDSHPPRWQLAKTAGCTIACFPGTVGWWGGMPIGPGPDRIGSLFYPSGGPRSGNDPSAGIVPFRLVCAFRRLTKGTGGRQPLRVPLATVPRPEAYSPGQAISPYLDRQRRRRPLQPPRRRLPASRTSRRSKRTQGTIMAKSRWEKQSVSPRGGTYINLAGTGCLRRNSCSQKGLRHGYSLPTPGTTWQAVQRTGGPCPARGPSYLRFNRRCARAWNTELPPSSAAARPGGAKRPGARVQARGTQLASAQGPSHRRPQSSGLGRWVQQAAAGKRCDPGPYEHLGLRRPT